MNDSENVPVRYLRPDTFKREMLRLNLVNQLQQAEALGIGVRQLQRLLSTKRGTSSNSPVTRHQAFLVRLARLTACSEWEFIDWDPPLDDPATEMTMYAKANLVQLDMIPHYLESFAPDISQMISWSRVLPCSWEDSSFMEEHHKSLFSPKVCDGDEELCDALVNAYNEYGHTARKRFETDERRKNIAFDMLMFESDLRLIGEPESIEYFKVCRNSRIQTLNRALDLLADSDHVNSRLWLINAEEEELLIQRRPRWHATKIGWDSVIVVKNKAGDPVFSFWREMPNIMTRLSLAANDLGAKSLFIVDAEDSAEKDVTYTSKVIRDILENVESRKSTEFPVKIR